MLGGAKERQRVMAPVVDMFNHALVESSYQYNAVARQFELYTGKFYREGEEVFLNYDPKSNADYLMQYGFVVEGNAHDFVGMVASIGPDAPYYKDKEITNAMLVGALVPAVASCAASFQLAMSAEATAAWFMSAAGFAEEVEILDMEYST